MKCPNLGASELINVSSTVRVTMGGGLLMSLYPTSPVTRYD